MIGRRNLKSNWFDITMRRSKCKVGRIFFMNCKLGVLFGKLLKNCNLA
jgi:hypothetical protein